MIKKTAMYVFVMVLFLSGTVYSQTKAKPGNSETVNQVPSAGQNQTSVIPSSGTKGVSFTLGGGYFKPMGDMSSILKPSWNVVLSARNNNMSGTLFGAGFDVSYSTLKDKDFGSGRMTYVTALPHVTAALNIFNLFDLVGKGGAGLTAITSKVNGDTNSSVSFTLGAGGGISRVFGRNFIIGVEADFLYYMQRSSSKSVCGFMYMGYRM